MTRNTTAEPIRIIEYDPSYAGAVAEMWNRSSESWGGGTTLRTEDSVRREMEVSSNLHEFLAVDGKAVVGFCSFARYRQDEGALYVPLLNVRPDYHGCKVGRNLILNAVRLTVEAGWPRLDLFTWAGNTKAVPMYKKCGFFWEKSEDSVHLMNFIPTVMQTEALAPYFEELDWYADSTRELPIEPDGRRERGFDLFDYTWQKGELCLRAEFEKTGRGLTALDTPDYFISTEIEEHDLVFGSAYKIRYHIKNRSASELAIEIKGHDDKNIRFELSAARTLAPGESVIVEGDFELDPVREEQHVKKTHPVVKSTWMIGGKRAEFRMGITPKFPAKLKIALPTNALYPGFPAELYLNVENNFASDAEFSFEWPEDEFLKWDNRQVCFTVPAKSKTAVPVPFILQSYGLYSQDVEVTAVPAGKQAVSFTTKLSVLMKGTQGRYGGDNGDQWVAVNGAFSLHLTKSDNLISMEYPGFNSPSCWWTYPKLGKPFAEEFSKRQAKEVKIYAAGECQVLEALYESEEFPGLEIKTVASLFPNGIAEFHHEICNTSSTALDEDVYLLTNFGFFSKRLILPYQGQIVDMGDEYSSHPDYWDSAQVTENWLFSQDKNITYGICWNPALKLLRPEYPFGLEHHLGRISAGEVVRTEATVFALGTFSEWNEFRTFARKQRDAVVPDLNEHVELTLGGGNLFAAEALKIELIERKMTPLAGSLELYVLNDGEAEHMAAEMELRSEQDMRSASFELALENTESPGYGAGRKIRVVYHGEDRVQERSGLWFPQSDEAVVCQMAEGPAGSNYTVSNGVLSIAAAPGFGSVVHSLKYKGEEWLNSSYPEAVPMSWWNPWHGGLGVGISGLGRFSQQEEPRSASWVKRVDVYGNVWKGLQLTTSIEKQEANRGITINQHYLMLPGVPVLCVLYSVTNRSGRVLPRYSLEGDSYIIPSPVFSEGWMEFPDEGKFLLGKTDAQIDFKEIMRIGVTSRKDMLHIVKSYPDRKDLVYVNNKLFVHSANHEFTLLNGATAWTQPTFLILGETALNQEDVRSLIKLTFTSPTDDKEISNADH